MIASIDFQHTTDVSGFIALLWLIKIEEVLGGWAILGQALVPIDSALVVKYTGALIGVALVG